MNEINKKSPGAPRKNFTKVFKVVKNKETNAFQFVNRGKPTNGAEMGEVTLAFDYNKANGVPNDAVVTNLHAVAYVTIPKVKKVVPAIPEVAVAV